MAKWKTERKWDPTKQEIDFERRLKENRYVVVGLKEYQSKTLYLIQKDGIEIEFDLVQDKRTGDKIFSIFERSFEIKKESEDLDKKLRDFMERNAK